MKTVFSETQEQRDTELSKYCGKTVKELQKTPIGHRSSLMVYKNSSSYDGKYADLYKNYTMMDSDLYIRTLSAYTVIRRSKDILSLEKIVGGFKDKRILDFGCGVGSHSIYCAQKGARVDLLDVDGPLFDYAKWRIKTRKLKNCGFLDHTCKLKENKYDIVVCLDVLEHVDEPADDFKRITQSLLPNGYLSLEVSTMVKPMSGHFPDSIDKWKRYGLPVLKKSYKQVHKKVYKNVR